MTRKTPIKSENEVQAEPPPKKTYNFAKKTGCTMEDLWWAYSSIKDPFTLGDVARLLEKEKALKVSVPWLSKMVRRYKLEDKRRMLFATQVDPKSLDEGKIRAFLEKMGHDYNPMNVLSGLQSRIVSVMAIRLPTSENTKYFLDMAEFYRMITDELMRTYQYKVQSGEFFPPARMTESRGETVTPFTKRPG